MCPFSMMRMTPLNLNNCLRELPFSDASLMLLSNIFIYTQMSVFVCKMCQIAASAMAITERCVGLVMGCPPEIMRSEGFVCG